MAATRMLSAVVDARVGRQSPGQRSPSLDVDSNAAAEPRSYEHRVHRFYLKDMLSDPVNIACLDPPAPISPDLEERLDFNITREGTACGLAFWFHPESLNGERAEIVRAVKGSQKTTQIYSHMLLLWPEQVELVSGDSVRVSMRATLSDKDYDWSWDSLIQTASGGKIQGIRHKRPIASSQQKNAAFLLEQNFSEDDEVFRFCLQLMNTGAGNEDIASALMRHFPKRYQGHDSALTQVTGLCQEFA